MKEIMESVKQNKSVRINFILIIFSFLISFGSGNSIIATTCLSYVVITQIVKLSRYKETAKSLDTLLKLKQSDLDDQICDLKEKCANEFHKKELCEESISNQVEKLFMEKTKSESLKNELKEAFRIQREKNLEKQINNLISRQSDLVNQIENLKKVISKMRQEQRKRDGITPKEFFEFYRNRGRNNGDYVGVYAIYNVDKDMYYVGQAKRLYYRINQHFTGQGNHDVYADYKYHDKFLIKMMKLTESGYDDLDKFESDMIEKYHACDRGYNKTKGNGN